MLPKKLLRLPSALALAAPIFPSAFACAMDTLADASALRAASSQVYLAVTFLVSSSANSLSCLYFNFYFSISRAAFSSRSALSSKALRRALHLAMYASYAFWAATCSGASAGINLK